MLSLIKFRQIYFIPFFIFAASCKFFESNSKKGPRTESPKSGQIIDINSINITRLDDGRKVNVRFAVKQPSFCKLTYGGIGSGSEITEVKNLDCPPTAAQYFEIPLDPNAIDKPLRVNISVWQDATNKTPTDQALKDEDGAVVTKMISPVTAVALVRYSAPTQLAEIKVMPLKKSASKGELLNAFRPKIQCGAPGSIGDIFANTGEPIKLADITTRGYATGKAVPHPSNPEFKRFPISTPISNENWEWNFSVDGNTYGFKTPPVAKLTEVSLQQNTQKSILSQNAVENNSKTLDLDSNLGIELRWTIESVSDESFVRITIGTPKADGTFPMSCTFDARRGWAKIEGDQLKNLIGEHPIQVQLETRYVESSMQKQDLAWMIASYDWKAGLARIQ